MTQFWIWLITTVLSIALAPKPPKPKAASIDDFDLPTAEEGRKVPVVFGTVDITGPNVLWYGDLSTKDIKKKSLFSSQTVGYRYFLGIHFGLCHGPVNLVSRIAIGEKQAWAGSITSNGTAQIVQMKLFGGDSREGGVLANMDFEFGGPTQAANTYLTSKISGLVPAHRGILGAVFRGGASYEITFPTSYGPVTATVDFGDRAGYVGNSPYVKPFAFRVKRTTAGWYGGTSWYAAKAEIGGEHANPAHILYETLTNPDWGSGLPIALLDDAAWRAAADQLYDEGFGLSLQWTQQSSVEDFQQVILDHIAASLVLRLDTGLWELKLIRDDYVIDDLPLFDESNVIDAKKREVRGWGETINALTFIYTDPDSFKPTGITVHDLANVAIQGSVPETISMPGIRSHALAAAVAQRELAARSTPMMALQIEVNRSAWDMQQADVFRYTWPKHGLEDVVFRTLKISKGTVGDNTVRIDAVQDIYGIGAGSYIVAPIAPDVPTTPDEPELPGTDGQSVVSATQTDPPASPVEGATYYVPTGATGAWATHVGEIATWEPTEGGWIYRTVDAGTVITAADTGQQLQTTGSGSAALPYTPIQTTGAVAFTSDITPAAISADQNDYNPTDLATASTLRLAATGAARTLTGLAGGTDGRILLVHNVGSLDLTLADDSASSTAANRFALNAAVTLKADQSTLLQYDSTSSRWRVIGGIGSGGSPTTTKGDLIVRGDSVDERLAVGANGDVVVADSSAAAGVTWGVPGIPSNAQSGNYTLTAADNGRGIDHASGAGSGDTYTIPANGTLALPVGFTFSVFNMDSGAVTVAITTDTLRKAGTGSTGSVSVPQYCAATFRKVSATQWLWWGVGAV
jgi:hypothetical protein